MPRSHLTARIVERALAGAVLLSVLVGCGTGGDGGGQGPAPSVTVSPTRTAPAPTRSPVRTDTPTAAGPSSPAPAQSDESSTGAGAAPSQGSGSSASDDDVTVENSGTGWAWVLVVVLVLAGVALTWLLIGRTRRRRAWESDFRTAEAQVAWTARALLPPVQAAGSPERIAGGWQAAKPPHITALEDQLTILGSSAKDRAGATRARALRDALRGAATTVESSAGGRGGGPWPEDIGAAIVILESALARAETEAR